MDFQLVCWYIGTGEAATKTQTITEATIVGAAAQYTSFKAEIEIVYDVGGGNNVDVGDHFSFDINLATGTSEVDNVIVSGISFHYQTSHVGIESGDA